MDSYIVRLSDTLITHDSRILLEHSDVRALGLNADDAVDLGLCSNGRRVRLLTTTPEFEVTGAYGTRTLRDLLRSAPEADFRCAARAVHLAHWDQTHQYCGSCGGKTERVAVEHARKCLSCGAVVYPRISPAIIVAVIRDGKLLLAHNARRAHGFYSVIAGFVDPGETLEECVAREVREETAVEVQNIRYMSSQPWPFPDSLMIAFICEYRSGEIEVDGSEIDHAYWCDPDNLPEVPPRPSVARSLIDWFVAHHADL